MEKSLKSVATAYGIYLGIALILITVLAYVFDVTLFSQFWFGIVILIFAVAMACIATHKNKKLDNEVFTFKKAFSSYFITIFIGTFISLLFTYILLNLVDPEAAQTLNEATMENARGMMEKFGAPESEINKAMAEMEGQNNFDIVNLLKGYAFQLVFYALIGLIVALIFKEKDPTKA